MLKHVLAAVQAIAVATLMACVGTVDTLITVQGGIVDETGASLSGCELALAEKSKASDRFLVRRPVDGKFKLDLFTWAPSTADLEVQINCPSRVLYVSRPYSVFSAERDGIDLGKIVLKMR